jgi:hypothetical protein
MSIQCGKVRILPPRLDSATLFHFSFEPPSIVPSIGQSLAITHARELAKGLDGVVVRSAW